MINYLGIFNRTSQEDPLGNFLFVVEIDGFSRFGFTKCSELEAKTEVIEYREGGDNTTPRKSPGQTKFSDITLSRGQILKAGAASEDIMTWYQQVFDISAKKPGAKADFRRTIEIVQFTREGVEAARWRVKEAWPLNFKPFGALDASASDNSITEMVICHEGFSPVNP